MKTVSVDRGLMSGGRLCVFVLAAASLAMPARAGSIFDDNWTPPTRKTPAETPSTPVSPTPVAPPSSPGTTPAVPGKTPAAPVARRPIPGKLDQARSRDNLNQVFAAPLKDASAAGRRKLASLLFDAVPQTADNPVDQYVLLGGAINAAKEGGNLRLGVQAADQLAQLFEVDAVALKADAALNTNLRAGSPDGVSDNAAVGLQVLNLLVAEDDLAGASRLAGLLKTIAPSAPSLASTILQRGKEVDALRVEHDRFAQQAEILKTKPDDPAANLAVGRYYCFARGSWDKGLAYLAKGSDPDLKRVAAEELGGATSGRENELLGDSWWDIGAKQVEPLRGAIRAHAVVFYKLAVGGATGLSRIKIEERIAKFATAGGTPVAGVTPAAGGTSAAGGAPAVVNEGWVDLFNGRDLTGWSSATGSKKTNWTVEGGVLCGYGEQGYLVTDRSHFENFTLRVEAQIAAGGNSGVYFRVSHSWPGHGGYQAQISDATDNDPMKTGSLRYYGPSSYRNGFLLKQCPVAAGQWFTMEVTTDGPRITISVDGKAVGSFVETGDAARKGAIALEAYHTNPVRFRKVQIKEAIKEVSDARAPATPQHTPEAPGLIPAANTKLVGRTEPEFDGTVLESSATSLTLETHSTKGAVWQFEFEITNNELVLKPSGFRRVHGFRGIGNADSSFVVPEGRAKGKLVQDGLAFEFTWPGHINAKLDLVLPKK